MIPLVVTNAPFARPPLPPVKERVGSTLRTRARTRTRTHAHTHTHTHIHIHIHKNRKAVLIPFCATRFHYSGAGQVERNRASKR
jgi:hypothetical protein